MKIQTQKLVKILYGLFVVIAERGDRIEQLEVLPYKIGTQDHDK
jgi:hypothetical protein